ncbi:MAG: hypothetical protein HC895_08140 [Leptolyngbyaceae cyanobacterium SM1_3_5]|nr:hypothetical protein [Leptolyngbyaceae cyanobacterium SM1_3_5]
MKHSFRFGLLLIPLIAVSPTAIASPLGAAAAPPVLIAQSTELLRIGDSNIVVALLQTQLASLGFYQGEIDGEFGAQTEAAVIQFQTSQGLVPDGIAGAQTLAALDRLTTSPSPIATNPLPPPEPVSQAPNAPASSVQGDRFSIVELQRRLQARGFYQGAIDGIMGPQTRAAIRAAQRAYGLEADDIVNGRFLAQWQQGALAGRTDGVDRHLTVEQVVAFALGGFRARFENRIVLELDRFVAADAN